MGDKVLSTIKELFKLVTDTNACLRKELDDVKDSLTYMNAKFEELRVTKQELDAVRLEHATLKAEKEQMAQTLSDSKKELTELKQYSRNNNKEIKGIPQKPNESLEEITKAIGDKTGQEVA